MDNTVKKSSQSDSFPSGLDNDNSVDTVCLNDLYPTDNRDLNSLFPERELRKLFRDVVAGIEDVRRFVDKTEKSLVMERSKKSSKKENWSRAAAGITLPFERAGSHQNRG